MTMHKSPFSKACLALALTGPIFFPAPALSADVPSKGEGNKSVRADLNAAADESSCPEESAVTRAGGLVSIAPDGTGATTEQRHCVILSGIRKAAQIGQTIEISDAANGPISGAGISTADSGSYALSLVNVRPNWTESALTGETDGLTIFLRQSKGDTAAILANVGARMGFAATLESYTFAADDHGRAVRGVRTQLGVVNPRDGGEYGLVLQAEDGDQLSAGLRIASIKKAGWKNYVEMIDRNGEAVFYVRANDSAIVGHDLLPATDLTNAIGASDKRYAHVHTEILDLSGTVFARLPKCSDGKGAGSIAFVTDVRDRIRNWGQVISTGGGSQKSFVKCDGDKWTAF